MKVFSYGTEYGVKSGVGGGVGTPGMEYSAQENSNKFPWYSSFVFFFSYQRLTWNAPDFFAAAGPADGAFFCNFFLCMIYFTFYLYCFFLISRSLWK